MVERIGIVTGGGDCPGLNAVIRAVVKAAAYRDWESVGFLGGYEGMLEPLAYWPLDYTELGGMLYRGGTILGTSNRGRFAAKTGHGEVRRVPEEISRKPNRASTTGARHGAGTAHDHRPAALRDLVPVSANH
jgi:6-phosphofructokinase 1